MKQTLLQIYFNIFKYLAKIYLLRNPAYIIWVTWSIWKTSCRMIISEILKQNLEDRIVYTSSKNFNWELWMSLSILWISDYEPNPKSAFNTIIKSFLTALFSKKMYDVIFLEYWIDHPGEMDFLLSVTKPNIWIVTKIDKVHSMQFSSEQNIADEKYKLLLWARDYSFINLWDNYYKKFENDIISQKLYFSTETNNHENEANIEWKNVKLSISSDIPKMDFELFFDWEKKALVSSNLVWEENVSYISIWFKILDLLNEYFYKESFFKNWSKNFDIKFKLQPSRFSMFYGIKNSLIFDSSYNASPLSSRKIITNFLELKNNFYNDHKTILCLGEMRELGDYTKKEHELFAEFVLWKCDYLFLIWDSMEKYFLPHIINLGFDKDKIMFFKNPFLLWENLKNFIEKLQDKYLILFKWSQNTIFLEESIKYILKNKDDEKLLCRQDEYWLEKKKNFNF